MSGNLSRGPIGHWGCVLLWIALVPALQAQDVQVSASVDSPSVGIQDTFQLTITVSGKDSGDAESPRLPRLRGFQIIGGPSVSTQFQWINGRSSSSKNFIYTLLPEKEGDFTIDPVEVSVGGKIYKAQPISIHVTVGTNPLRSPRRSILDPFADDDLRAPRLAPVGDEVFVTAELDRSSAYIGQQVTVSFHLYTQVSVTGLQLQESPPLTGFWLEDIGVGKNPTGSRKMINGKEYLDYVIKKQALFPNDTTKLKILPSTFAISVRLTGNDFFSFFGRNETIYRKTKEVTLEVKALPNQGRPANFNNAVGSFDLTSSLDKREASIGNAVSLRVKLSGKGNLKMIPDLPLPPMTDFTIYSSKRTENVRPLEGDVMGGEKTWEYIIVPKAAGKQTIPAFALSFFNPEQGKYEAITTAPLELTVRHGSDTGGGVITTFSGITKQNVTRQGTDINFIKLADDDLELQKEPVYKTAWFYLLACVPMLFNIGAFLYQRERSRENINVVLARSRRARRAALVRLKQAVKVAKSDPRRFYDEAALALSGYLTDKFNLPEIAVTTDSLEKTLTEKSVNQETEREIMACLQECDFGRFVSASSTVQTMRELANRIRKIVDTLEQA